MIDSMGEALALTADQARELTGVHGQVARALEDTSAAYLSSLNPALGGYPVGAGRRGGRPTT